MRLIEIITENDIIDIKSPISVNVKSKKLKKINNNGTINSITKIFNILKKNKKLKK